MATAARRGNLEGNGLFLAKLILKKDVHIDDVGEAIIAMGIKPMKDLKTKDLKPSAHSQYLKNLKNMH